MAKTILQILKFPQKIQNFNKLQYILAKFQESNGLITVTGALLNYLSTQSILVLRDFPIDSIEQKGFDLDLFISLQAYQDLAIFQQEEHPSMIKGRGRAKEGFSIYGIFERYCAGVLGKKLLKDWFLAPITDRISLEERQSTVELFQTIGNKDIKQLKSHIRNIQEFQTIIEKLNLLNMHYEYWKKLIKSIDQSILFLKCIKNLLKQNNPLLDRIHAFDESPLTDIQYFIKKICGINKENKQIFVNFQVNQELDEVKKIFDNMESLLDCYAQEVQQQLPKQCKVQSLALTFLPQMGYSIIVSKINFLKDFDQDSIAQQLNLPQDWIFQFELENGYYFKNDFMLKLDEIYGDIHGKIVDTEHAIFRELIDMISENLKYLNELKNLIALSDVYLCLSQLASQLNLCKPIFTENSILMIKEGRNILVEHSNIQNRINGNPAKFFIPNDTFIYDYKNSEDQNIAEDYESSLINKNYSNRCQIITGANYSGKSIYLKQIGVIVFLAHIGSFVPAKFCKLGIFDAVFTHMNNMENLDFNWQLSYANHILKQSSNRSLILMDEFGKNTDFINGISLFCTFIKRLNQPYFETNYQLSKNTNEEDRDYDRVPMSLLVTHFHDIFQKQLIQQNYITRFLTMDILFEPAENKCIYLYKLKPGQATISHAIHLAQSFFHSESLIERSKQILRDLKQTGSFNIQEKIENTYLDQLDEMINSIKSLLNN